MRVSKLFYLGLTLLSLLVPRVSYGQLVEPNSNLELVNLSSVDPAQVDAGKYYEFAWYIKAVPAKGEYFDTFLFDKDGKVVWRFGRTMEDSLKTMVPVVAPGIYTLVVSMRVYSLANPIPVEVASFSKKLVVNNSIPQAVPAPCQWTSYQAAENYCRSLGATLESFSPPPACLVQCKKN